MKNDAIKPMIIFVLLLVLNLLTGCGKMQAVSNGVVPTTISLPSLLSPGVEAAVSTEQLQAEGEALSANLQAQNERFSDGLLDVQGWYDKYQDLVGASLDSSAAVADVSGDGNGTDDWGDFLEELGFDLLDLLNLDQAVSDAIEILDKKKQKIVDLKSECGVVEMICDTTQLQQAAKDYLQAADAALIANAQLDPQQQWSSADVEALEDLREQLDIQAQVHAEVTGFMDDAVKFLGNLSGDLSEFLAKNFD